MGWSSIAPAVLVILVVMTDAGDLIAQNSPIAVRVDTIDGLSKTGTLSGVSAQGVNLLVDDSTPQTIALDQILAIQRTDNPPTTPPGARIGLDGGSRLAIAGVKSEGAGATIKIRGGDELQVPLKMLRWIRFRNPSAAVDPQWLGLIDRPRASDSLVIRRPGDAIDEVAGIVLAISDENISFSLDGDTMQAPIAKLEGVVFTTAGTDAVLPANKAGGSVLVDDIFGSRFVATAMTGSDDGTIELKLSDELKYRLPIQSISKIELTGSVEFLAMVQPVETKYVPLIHIGIGPELSRQWLNPEVQNGRDLVMRAASHIEYRLSEGFQTLVGSVDFDPAVTAGGKSVVKILLDGKPVWEQSLQVTDASSRGFELPIGGARRVRFEISSENDGDLGDTVRLRQPRITK
ncbi:MAG TPA: hypothetical protein DDZ51_05920 [Planctomycetaceae bacterium]|nr:hypothetical protein [Planctomycetaceae bacterium]